MTKFLIRKFVPNYQDTNNRVVRQRYGSFSGAVGIVCNILLFILKIIAGAITSSISIISDAFNNLSDAGSSIITLFGFHLASAPADDEHPFGHGRVEYITGIIISFVIIYVGIELLQTSVGKIFSGQEQRFSVVAFSILIVSIMVKAWMWKFYQTVGHRIESVAVLAAASDSRNDCLATLVVAIGTIIGPMVPFSVDGWFGAAVSIFIIYSGYVSLKDSINPLLGGRPDDRMLEYIDQVVSKNPNAFGYHNLVAHDYGPGNWAVSFDVVLRGNLTLLEAHRIITAMGSDIENHLGCMVTIHPDPYDDEEEDRKEAEHLDDSIGENQTQVEAETIHEKDIRIRRDKM